MTAKKNITLIIALALIAIAIVWIESKVAHPHASGPAVSVTAPATATTSSALLIDDSQDPLAKEISNPSDFVNTPGNMPITLSQYIGKSVVLIDFFIYSCINCQRSTPYLEAWYEKYKDQGLVVIGIHTPEFEFEKVYANVAAAMQKWGVTFPVVMDNDYGTWNAYQNQYWPHKYLIDINGKVVYDHIGEGGYDEAEEEIQAALKDRATVLGTGQTISGGLVNPAGAVSEIDTESPETYFGNLRNEYLGNGPVGQSGTQTFILPKSVEPNTLYLGGSWDIEGEYAQSVSPTTEVEYEYNAKNIYFVANAGVPTKVEVYQDGKLMKTLSIQAATLYTLVENVAQGVHIIDLKITGGGLQAFTFTFG